MSREMTKSTKWVCAQRRQISLGIRPVWSDSSLCAKWVAKDPRFLHADRENSDQTGRMPRLIWVFAGRTLILLVLSCRGSNPKFCSWTGQFESYLIANPEDRLSHDVADIVGAEDDGLVSAFISSVVCLLWLSEFWNIQVIARFDVT